MSTPDPTDPIRDDTPTAPVDLPPPPPAQSAANQAPPQGPPSWHATARPSVGSTPTAGQPGLVAGVVLVVIGAVFLLVRLVDLALGAGSWALWIVVPGLAMLAGSFAIPSRAGLGLAVPGAIIAAVGGILWVQAAYGLYATWAYAWALVAPTAPGVAMLLHGSVRGDWQLAGEGLRTTLVGLGLFIGFALFFEGVIGLSGHRLANLDEVLPYGAIGLGVLLVVLSLLGGGRAATRSR